MIYEVRLDLRFEVLSVRWSASYYKVCLLLCHNKAAKSEPLTTVSFIRVVLAVVVMVADPTVRNAVQIITAEFTLSALAWN